jgi:hypothetical protein
LKCVAGDPDRGLNALCAHIAKAEAFRRELLAIGPIKAMAKPLTFGLTLP